MPDRHSIIEALIRKSMKSDGASTDESEGILTFLLPSTSRLRTLLKRDVIRLAFPGTYTSGKDVPPDVEIVLPGRPVFDAVMKYIQEQPCLAVVRRKKNELIAPVTEHIVDWGSAHPSSDNVDQNRGVFVCDHYFKVRFISQSIEERIVRISTDIENDIVNVSTVKIDSIEDYQDSSLPEVFINPVIENLRISSERAEHVLHQWIMREVEPMQYAVKKHQKQAELRIQAFFERRREERKKKRDSIISRLKRRGETALASPQLESLLKKLELEAQEDTATLAARLEELRRRFRLWEVQVEPIGCAIVWTHRTVRRVEIMRGSTTGTAIFWFDEGEHEELGPICKTCYHTDNQMTLCTSGHIVCQKCTIECACCHKPLCSACTHFTCDICGNHICHECVMYCKQCGHSICRKHLHKCEKGHGWYCERCVISCAKSECGRMICPQCIVMTTCYNCKKVYCWKCKPEVLSRGKMLCHVCIKEAPRCSVCDIGIWPGTPLKLRCTGCNGYLCIRCAIDAYSCESCGKLLCIQEKNDHRDVFSRCKECGGWICAHCLKTSLICRLCEFKKAEIKATHTENTRLIKLQQRRVTKHLLRIAKERGYLSPFDVIVAPSTGYPWDEPFKSFMKKLGSAGIYLGVRMREVDLTSVLDETFTRKKMRNRKELDFQNSSFERLVAQYIQIWQSYVEHLYSFPNIDWPTYQELDPTSAFQIIADLAQREFPNWRVPARHGSILRSLNGPVTHEDGLRILSELSNASGYITEWELRTLCISYVVLTRFLATQKKINIIEKPLENDSAWRDAIYMLNERWEEIQRLLSNVTEITQQLLQIISAEVGDKVMQIAKALNVPPMDTEQLTAMAVCLVLQHVNFESPEQLLFAVEWGSVNLLRNYGDRSQRKMLPIDECDHRRLKEDAVHPADIVSLHMLQERIDSILRTLSYRERGVIKLRYGISHGFSYTRGEIGSFFTVDASTIKRVEQKAIRKLRHPVRVRKLVGFLSDSTGSECQMQILKNLRAWQGFR